jgi:O-methyltransferase domain
MSKWTAAKTEGAARLLELIQLRLISEAIHVVAALGIADSLSSGPKSVEALSDACHTDAAPLRRVMRALTSFGLFTEDPSACFSLTSTGEFLKSDTDGSLHPAALFFGGERAAREIGLFLKCVREGKSMPDLLFGGSWTEWMQSDPEQKKLFNDVMTAFSSINLAGLFEAYDFTGVKTIVDVGGGHGRLLVEILNKNPGMRGVLLDMPHALEGGRKAIAGAGLAGRCEAVSGDFFVSVPSSADAYLLSRVIHDWDEEKAVQILKVIRQAIAPLGRVIIVENLLRPEQRAVYPVLSDLNMLIRTGGCERTEAEYRSLYFAAGFEHTRTISTGSPMGTTVIEGRPL